jgi:hypothetical protein
MLLGTLLMSACNGQKTTPVLPVVSDPEAFAKYWYSGVAEVSSYELSQNRYGEVREGDIVLVYVTEDFLPGRQVKNESGKSNSVSVLKMNMMKKFVTGIYDYSVMTSVFTPVDREKSSHSLKVTFSSQDWCGQSFAQMNLKEGALNFETRSYFENPGDENSVLPLVNVEEDIWTLMRIEPQKLPMGKFEMVPAQEYIRMGHIELKTYKADARLLLQIGSGGKEHYVYQLNYPDLNRKVEWHCENVFPYKVLFWQETQLTPTGTTKSTATLKETKNLPYWELNGNEHGAQRDSLKLRYIVK